MIARHVGLPGVTSAGVSRHLAVGERRRLAQLFGTFGSSAGRMLARAMRPTDRGASVGYFETLRARLLQGRYFTETDDGSRPRVAIINRTMAKQEFAWRRSAGETIDRRIRPRIIPSRSSASSTTSRKAPWIRSPSPAVYEPFNQDPTQRLLCGRCAHLSLRKRFFIPWFKRSIRSILG